MDAITMMLQELEHCPPLPEARIRALCRQAQKGHVESRHLLLRAHLRLVVHVAKQFYRHGEFVELGDCIQQGALGLLIAIDKFKLHKRVRGKPVKFKTYAYYWISHSIRREKENKGRVIAVPVNVQRVLRKQMKLQEMVSLDDELSRDETMGRIDIGEDVSSPEWHCHNRDVQRRVQALLKHLPRDERQIVEDYFGINATGRNWNLKEIASKLSISGEWARQRHHRAVKALRIRGKEMFDQLWPEGVAEPIAVPLAGLTGESVFYI